MSGGFGLSIQDEWMEEESDHRNCYNCGEMIIGKMHSYILFVDNEAVNLDTDKKYCTACYLEPAEDE